MDPTQNYNPVTVSVSRRSTTINSIGEQRVEMPLVIDPDTAV